MKVVKIILTVCGMLLLLCSILVGGIFYMLSNDVVHGFQYYKVEDTHTWDDKNWTLILVRNRDNATVLQSVLDYYSEDDNEVLVVTLDGYYIFLGETLVYSETYNGGYSERMWTKEYSAERGEVLLSKYRKQSWEKWIKEYSDQTVGSEDIVSELTYLPFRYDGVLMDITQHRLLTYPEYIRIQSKNVYVYTEVGILIIDLKQKQIYTIGDKEFPFSSKEAIMNYNEFVHVINTSTEVRNHDYQKPSVFNSIYVHNIDEMPISSQEIYKFYVEAVKKVKEKRGEIVQ
ncbi:hypothetical protein [Veillonella sp. CHU110]|uniref:hypothetical protein n=1 Tax=Veillonella sp. CHU110 TaxID=2490947 RepID=UPI000F8F41BA|nr:hypothetical protein [Veillonella sp. CHU110]